VTLDGPFTVSDNKITGSNSVLCPSTPTSLAPGDPAIVCTATYQVTQADLNAGKVVNSATAYAVFNSGAVTSNTDSITVNGTQSKALKLVKSSTTASYSKTTDTISYRYTLTNTGNVTLDGPFTVSDNKITGSNSVLCPSTPTSLAPGDPAIVCTATYTVIQDDIDAGSVKNTATGHATFGGKVYDSNTDFVTVNAAGGSKKPGLAIAKIADPKGFSMAGDKVAYTYTLTNTGNVTLTGPFTVSDNKISGAIACGDATVSLTPTETTSCTATYTVTDADVTAGKVTNTATASVTYGGNPVQSDPASVTVTVAQLSLVKSTTTEAFLKAGDTIAYTYTLTNDGPVALAGPFTVTDDKITGTNTVVCPPTPATLAPAASIVCTATYTVTDADVTAGKVTNTAMGHARYGDLAVDTDPTAVTVKAEAPAATVTPEPSQIVLSETATPAHTATPPVTSSSSSSSSPDGNPAPLLALLICLAFGGLGLLAVQAQRKSISR
jgi:uncharacterized repeat protein (TIGR01451 family)